MKKLTRIQAALVNDIYSIGIRLGKNGWVPIETVNALVDWHFSSRTNVFRILAAINAINPCFAMLRKDRKAYKVTRAPDRLKNDKSKDIDPETPEAEILSNDDLDNIVKKTTGSDLHELKNYPISPNPKKPQKKNDDGESLDNAEATQKPRSRPGPKKPIKQYDMDRRLVVVGLLKLQKEGNGHFSIRDACDTIAAVNPETQPNRMLNLLKKRGWMEVTDGLWQLTHIGETVAANYQEQQ